MVFVSFFMLAIAGLVAAKLAVVRSIGNRENEAKAAYLLESAKEEAVFLAGTSSVGWNFNPEEEDTAVLNSIERDTYLQLFGAAEKMGIPNCFFSEMAGKKPCVKVRVIGSTDDEKAKLKLSPDSTPKWYSVPPSYVETVNVSGIDSSIVRGTGDMAEKCGSDTDVEGAKDADNPCHWNKLKFGESAEISLFAPDPVHPEVFKKPGSFRVRIRTPKCADIGGDCPHSASDRVILYPQVSDTAAFLDLAKDKVLVQWMIVDSESDVTLVASEMTDDTDPTKRPTLINDRNSSTNTELTAGRINEALTGPRLSNYVVLNENFWATDINKDICTAHPYGSCQSIGTEFFNNEKVTKPVLRLSLVTRPRRVDSDGNQGMQIPYLEYQILADEPILSSESAFAVSADVGDFHKEAKGKYRHPMKVGGFAIEN